MTLLQISWCFTIAGILFAGAIMVMPRRWRAPRLGGALLAMAVACFLAGLVTDVAWNVHP